MVIIGGGFAGIATAQALMRSKAEVVLLDRRNHHLFQPLLYQVATAALSPANIAAPIRKVLRKQKNTRVLMGEVRRVSLDSKTVSLADGTNWGYDYLVLAAGATHSYFGHDEWSSIAPGLKTVEDALEIRRRLLTAFERAELERDTGKHRDELTFVIVGAGPTGVEMAGAISEIATQVLAKDFRHVDTRSARVILVEGQDRVLAAFHAASSDRALRDLQDLGVEVRTGTVVTGLAELQNGAADVRMTHKDSDGSERTDRVTAACVFWAAGVRAPDFSQSMKVEKDRAGRILVGTDLSVPGHPEVFVAGDLASAKSADTGKPVPGVAQGGIQGGGFVGRIIAKEIAHHRVPSLSGRAAFSYFDKGSMATIGKSRAVAEIGGRRFSGAVAWLLWVAIHILFLIGFRNKMLTLIDWAYAYTFHARGARLITGVWRGH